MLASTGPVLGQYSVAVLGQYWASTGPVLACAGPVLASTAQRQYWASTGQCCPVPGWPAPGRRAAGRRAACKACAVVLARTAARIVNVSMSAIECRCSFLLVGLWLVGFCGIRPIAKALLAY